MLRETVIIRKKGKKREKEKKHRFVGRKGRGKTKGQITWRALATDRFCERER